MKAFVEKLFEEMELSLKEVGKETSNGLQKAERCCQVINGILMRLKEFMTGYTFHDAEDEILFFKEYKPLLFKELIFYSELTYIEAKKPIGKKEQIKSYFPHVLDQIQEFFVRNHQLYIYYQLGKSDMDSTLFMRNSMPVSLIRDYSFDFDPTFSTVNSSKLAKIMAYENLTDHIRKIIHRLEMGSDAGGSEVSGHEWTDTKSGLIELAYALHSRGAVNHGKSDVKAIIMLMESLFNVQVGNFYRTFQSMRGRKKNRTIYLDSLKESLVKRMDDTDMGY